MRVLLVLLLLSMACLGLSHFVFTTPEQRLYKQTAILMSVVFAAIFVFIVGLGLIHSTV